MPKSPVDALAVCIQATDAETINAARAVCDHIEDRVKYIDLGNAGRIAECAKRAEEALFDLLNAASSYGYCVEAGNAIEEYRKGNHA